MSAHRDPLDCPFQFHVVWNGIFDWRVYQSDGRKLITGGYLCGLSPRYLTERAAMKAASELRRVAADAWYVACGGMDEAVSA